MGRGSPCLLILALLALLAAPAGAAEPAAPDFVPAVERALPVTVAVTARKPIPGPNPGRGTFHELGAGVVVRADGMILTCHHVVDRALEITVELPDRRRFAAAVVGLDPDTDLAVIRIEGAGELPEAALGDAEAVRVGEWVLAVGNPLGLNLTVTKGIISGRGRSGMRYARDEFLLQTDAPMNPGNSGGPLVNLAGEVIGIATAIPSSERATGIGFAVPISTARRYLPDLMAGRRAVRSWAGFAALTDVDGELAPRLGLPGPGGVLIQDVIADSPAAAAGLRAQDVLLELDGRALPDQEHLKHRLRLAPIGQAVELTVWREGRRQPVSLTLGPKPEVDLTVEEEYPDARLGLVVGPLHPELAMRMQFQGRAVVIRVVAGPPAAAAALRPFDLVLQLGGRATPTPEAFRAAAEAAAGEDEVEVIFVRAGQRRQTFLRPRAE